MQSLIIKVGNLALDSVTREVSIGSAHPRLTATELALLEILMQRSPATVSRRAIALAVWNRKLTHLGRTPLMSTWPGFGPRSPSAERRSKPSGHSVTG